LFDWQAEVGLTAANIVLTGGNMNMQQIEQRVLSEVRPLVSDLFSVQVGCPVCLFVCL
jgi:actin-related protein